MDAKRPIDAATPLLDWYDRHRRDLPWRAAPGERPDPYRVWLSEVMLQQTTVATVRPRFTDWIARWPTFADLAAADEAAVMAAWAGLGYYARARNLLAAARVIAAEHGGRLPDSEAALRALPGFGDYTAAAVAAIAFGRRAVVVDANVERVVTRLFALEEALPGSRPAIRALTDTITPEYRAGDFAQALMDMGATVCTTRAPRCLLCPIAADCAARALGEPERFPVKAPKKARPTRKGRAFWIERDERVWLVRRAGKGLLGGMRALPDDGWSARADGHGEPPVAGRWDSAGRVGHVFTHFALELGLSVHLGEFRGDPSVDLPGEGEWWPIDRLDEAGLPTLFAKAAALALAEPA